MKRPSNGRARWCARVISAPSVQKRTAGTSWPAWNGKWPLPGNRRLRTSCSATPARITAPGTISPSRVGRRAIATPTSTSARNRNASGLAASASTASAANANRLPACSDDSASRPSAKPSANGNAAESTVPAHRTANVRDDQRVAGPHSRPITIANATAAAEIDASARTLMPRSADSG